METNLIATVRENSGSAQSRRSRGEGNIPAVVYGLGMEPVSVEIDAREFTNALKTEAGSNVIFNLEIGKEKYTALAREIQKHVYRNEFLHVDFVQVDLSQTVDADVQVNFTGIPMGVKEEGGVMSVRELAVQGLKNDAGKAASAVSKALDLDGQAAQADNPRRVAVGTGGVLETGGWRATVGFALLTIALALYAAATTDFGEDDGVDPGVAGLCIGRETLCTRAEIENSRAAEAAARVQQSE